LSQKFATLFCPGRGLFQVFLSAVSNVAGSVSFVRPSVSGRAASEPELSGSVSEVSTVKLKLPTGRLRRAAVNLNLEGERMLFLNLPRVFAMRGIERPFTFLVGHGISRPTATNLLNQRVSSIKHGHLELICELLRCEPNDLYEWRPAGGMQNAADHPLRRLRRDNSAGKVREIIRTAPLEKLSELERLLNETEAERDE
jgi:hypothetical protein